MDAALIAALEARFPVSILLTTIELPGHTIRWACGGFVRWGGEVYRVRDADYGTLDSVSEIEDGVEAQAATCSLTTLPPDMDAVAALGMDPTVQGSRVTVHLGAVDRTTGLLIGEPDLLFRGKYDQPRLGVSEGLSLIIDCITEAALMLEPHDERRLTDSFQRSVWPDDLGYEHVAKVRRVIPWREDSKGAIT